MKDRDQSGTMVPLPMALAARKFDALQSEVLALDKVRESTSMQLALLVRHIHDQRRYAEAGHATFKEWCESIDRTDRWGRYLVAAAEHVGRVENPRHARALAGLSADDADAVVAAADAGGPVTSKSLIEARKESRARGVAGIAEAAREITEAVQLRKVRRCLEKTQLAAQQHGGFPEWFFKSVEKGVAYCDVQLAVDEAA